MAESARSPARAISGNTRPTLLERLQEGCDPLAWEEFYQRYWALIYASAKRRGCSDPTAEEIVQEVMLKVFEQKDVFQYDPARGRVRCLLASGASGSSTSSSRAHHCTTWRSSCGSTAPWPFPRCSPRSTASLNDQQPCAPAS